MKRMAGQKISPRKEPRGLPARVAGFSRALLFFPFKLVGTILKRAAQVLFSILFLVLHPHFKWLFAQLSKSTVYRDYIKPAMQHVVARYYDPYFVFLSRLPPYWATFSIALPLAALEPAKIFATVLIAERPRVGLILWLFLQGLSLLLIDRTWIAVRPQSRKIWLVSRLHAWGWLNLEYGKYWVTSSLFYQALIRWREQARLAALAFWSELLALRHRR